MAAQTRNEDRPYREAVIIGGVPAQANTHVYQGSLLEIDATGHVAPATKAADKNYYGVAVSECDNNPGAAGARSMTVRRRGAVRLAKTGAAARGQIAYVEDDQTITTTSTGASPLGIVVDVEGDDVWVDLGAVAPGGAY